MALSSHAMAIYVMDIHSMTLFQSSRVLYRDSNKKEPASMIWLLNIYLGCHIYQTGALKIMSSTAHTITQQSKRRSPYPEVEGDFPLDQAVIDGRSTYQAMLHIA